MKKRSILPALVVILLCTNMITLYFLWVAQSTEEVQDSKPQTQATVYQMEGEGEHWAIHDYKVMMTPQKIKRSLANVDYLGESKQIDQSTFFSSSVVEDNKPVLSNGSSSINGAISILTNLDFLGSIESNITEFDKDINQDSIQNTKVTLTWKDNDGNLHEETIPLTIRDSFTF